MGRANKEIGGDEKLKDDKSEDSKKPEENKEVEGDKPRRPVVIYVLMETAHTCLASLPLG